MAIKKVIKSAKINTPKVQKSALLAPPSPGKSTTVDPELLQNLRGLEINEIELRKTLRDAHMHILSILKPLEGRIPNLSVQFWLLLRALYETPNSRPSDIATSLSMLMPAVSRSLNCPMASKLVTSKVAAGDRREVLYSLTAAGKRIVLTGLKLLDSVA